MPAWRDTGLSLRHFSAFDAATTRRQLRVRDKRLVIPRVEFSTVSQGQKHSRRGCWHSCECWLLLVIAALNCEGSLEGGRTQLQSIWRYLADVRQRCAGEQRIRRADKFVDRCRWVVRTRWTVHCDTGQCGWRRRHWHDTSNFRLYCQVLVTFIINTCR